MAQKRTKRQYLTPKRLQKLLNLDERRLRSFELHATGHSYREAAAIMRAEGLKACHMTVKRDFRAVRFEMMLHAELDALRLSSLPEWNQP